MISVISEECIGSMYLFYSVTHHRGPVSNVLTRRQGYSHTYLGVFLHRGKQSRCAHSFVLLFVRWRTSFTCYPASVLFASLSHYITYYMRVLLADEARRGRGEAGASEHWDLSVEAVWLVIIGAAGFIAPDDLVITME